MALASGFLALMPVSGRLYLKILWRIQFFYFEALLVLSTILHSTSFGSPVSKLVIYTDNMNTVQMFNSLLALPQYNEIIKAAVNHMISDLDNHIQLRVMHISGNLNSHRHFIPWSAPHCNRQCSKHCHSHLFTPMVSEGSWGHQNYDPILCKVQAKGLSCLDEGTSPTWTFPCFGPSNWHINLEKLWLCSQFLLNLCSNSQPPSWTHPRYS